MNVNFVNVKEWLTSHVPKRKYYELEELLSMYQEYTSTIITKKSFTRILTILVESNTILLKRVHVKKRHFRYIILHDSDKDIDLNTIRFSKRKVSIPTRVSSATPEKRNKNETDRKVPTPSASPSATPSSLPNITPEKRKETESNNKLSTMISKMTKSSLPMALSFFLGKRRAKIIIEEEEQRSSGIEDLSIRYKALIYDHLENQIKKLQNLLNCKYLSVLRFIFCRQDTLTKK